MKRVYHVDDYKSTAVDLLCIIGNQKVIDALSTFGGANDMLYIIRTAAVLTRLSNTIDPTPIVVDDTEYKKAVYSKH